MKTALRLLLAPYRFSVDRLFRMGEVGWAHWYDSPSDYPGGNHPYLYQNSAGTTPVTAVGQSVGLILDRAYGGMRGASLSAPTASLAGGATNNGDGTFTIPASGSIRFDYTLAQLSNGMLYEFEIERVGVASTGTITVDWCDGTPSTLTAASAGTKAYHRGARATYDATYRFLDVVAGGSSSITFRINFARSVPGTHRIQATSASRPLLMARVNLLLASEDFSSASWTKTDTTVTANSIAAPDGNTTADLLTEGFGGNSNVNQSITAVASAVHKARRVLKRGNSDWVVVGIADNTFATGVRQWVNLATGALGPNSTFGVGASFSSASIENLGNGWYAVNLSGHIGATTIFRTYTHSASSDVSTTRVNNATRYEWGADLRTADDAAKNIPSYQRVGATAADHDTAGFPHYLLYDGTDDSYASAATVDGSGSDKVTVVTGVTKLSDAAVALVLEHTADANSNNGAFFVSAPQQSASSTLGFKVRGTIASIASGYNASTYTAPTTRILSLVADLASSVKTGTVKPYIDGVLDQGEDDTSPVNFGGNFANATIYFGSRGGSSSRFNGREYASIGRFSPMSETERNRLEQWTAKLMRMP